MVTNQRWATPATSTGSMACVSWKPFQEPGYLVPEALGRRSGIVDALGGRWGLRRLPSARPASSRHWPARIRRMPLAPGREQSGVPRKQPFFRQGLGVVPGGVERHLDDAVDVSIRPPGRPPMFRPRAGCNRRADLVGGEYFSPRSRSVLTTSSVERAQRGFAAHLETQGFHPTEQHFPWMWRVRARCLAKPGRILLDAGARALQIRPDEPSYYYWQCRDQGELRSVITCPESTGVLSASPLAM